MRSSDCTGPTSLCAQPCRVSPTESLAGFFAFPSAILWLDARPLLGLEAGATILDMPKDADLNGSANGASPYPPVTPEERAAIDAQKAWLREMHKQSVAEGFDGTELLPELEAIAATWSE